VQPPGQLQQHLLQPRLHARGQVGVLGRELLARRPALGQRAPGDRVGPEPAVAGGPDRLAQDRQVPRHPVRRQRHHLVLVGRAQEAEVLGDLLVEQAERVRQRLGRQHAERTGGVVPAGQVGHGLAAAVQHEHRGLRVRRGQPGRGGVRDVVRHVPDLLGVETRQRGGQELRRPLRVHGAQVVPGVGDADLLGRPDQLRVE
jgi:hypothetical protein